MGSNGLELMRTPANWFFTLLPIGSQEELREELVQLGYGILSLGAASALQSILVMGAESFAPDRLPES